MIWRAKLLYEKCWYNIYVKTSVKCKNKWENITIWDRLVNCIQKRKNSFPANVGTFTWLIIFQGNSLKNLVLRYSDNSFTIYGTLGYVTVSATISKVIFSKSEREWRYYTYKPSIACHYTMEILEWCIRCMLWICTVYRVIKRCIYLLCVICKRHVCGAYLGCS